MINQINKLDTKRWYLTEGDNVFLFSKVKENLYFSTGQPSLKCFLTEDELKIEVDSIKGNGFYEESLKENMKQ